MYETTWYQRNLTLNRKMASVPSMSMATYKSHLPITSLCDAPAFRVLVSKYPQLTIVHQIHQKSSSVAHSTPSCLKKLECRQILTHSV